MSFDRSRFFAVPSKGVEEARWWLEPLLEEFERATGFVTAEDVLNQAKAADCQLWSYHDGERFRGVVITRIHTLSRSKVCSLWGCLGIDATEIMEGVFAELESWALSIGCTDIEVVGRPGWIKKLPGFTCKAWMLQKSLN